jgi:beta-aspartyl-peptidase (threonine type)
MPDFRYAIIVHGGAKSIHPSEEGSHLKDAKQAAIGGFDVLKKGGTALDAVEVAIKRMESGGIFNAGVASALRADGSVQMDASIMDGRTLDIGAVAGLVGIENPISVARALLGEKPTLLVGQYANDFARAKGFSSLPPESAKPPVGETCDTVGCVALDQLGNIAVGLSTGGLKGAMPGRVGDVPLPGCGFYADNERGGLCMSGDGESIARVALASEILQRSERMDSFAAIEEGLLLLKRVGGEAGCIMIDKHGQPAWSHSSNHFSVAYQTSEMAKPETFLQNPERRP